MGLLGKEIDKRLSNGGRAIVLGLGVSNEPMARMLAASGLRDRLVIRDAKTADELGGKAFDLVMAGARIEAGREPAAGLCDSDDMSDTVIFRSPGIRPDAGDLSSAVAAGALLTSEMEWFCDITPARIIAVTGSDGKTTTTTLTHLILKEASGGSGIFVGGNIGIPLLDRASEMKDGDTAVLELSSFQLQTMNGPAERACITNITPNHLNWHTGMDEYIRAKYNILGKKTKIAVLNALNPLSASAAKNYDGKVIFFTAHNTPADSFSILTHGKPDASLIYLKDGHIVYTDGMEEERILAVSDIVIPGIHNIENYMAAAALTRGLADNDAVRRVASSFGGVEHRFELVRVLDGVKYYNSSIDSTPSRTMAALSNLNCRPVVILGGKDKGVPFDGLAAELFDRASAAVITGAATPMIYDAIMREAAKRDNPESLRVECVDDFIQAVNTARKLSQPGSAVLLSPACTSFDRFRNFEERGKLFKDIVNSFK